MNHTKLRYYIFLALCCDLGLFSKRLISPIANLITGSLHIPGGIGTSFSLMFLVIAAALTKKFGCGALMGAIQSIVALSLGMVGSMGILSPIGYILPGLTIDCIFLLTKELPISLTDRIVLANALAAVCASLTANMIVFHLRGYVLLLYLCVAGASGAVCGLLGSKITARIRPVIHIKPEKVD